jgi:DNA repair exonuclease SbcCD ATPase subunit
MTKRLLEAEHRIPDEIHDDETSGKVGDFIKQITAARKGLDAIRVGEKEVYLEGSRMVDGVMKRLIEPLDAAKERIQKRQTEYLERKRAAELRRQREEAEAKRLEAERLQKEAEEREREAQRLKREAEDREAKAKADAEERERKIREDAENERVAKQAEIDRLEREKRELQEAKDKADKDASERLKAVNAELKETKEELKQVDRSEREGLKEVKQEVKAVEAEVHATVKAAKAEERTAGALLDDAVRADKTATKIEKMIDAPAGQAVRTRGEQGSVSTFRTEWQGTLTDRAEIDLEALRPYFTDDAIQLAINAFVKANAGRQLAGAWVRQENIGVTR